MGIGIGMKGARASSVIYGLCALLHIAAGT
jgi:hypothetical protein